MKIVNYGSLNIDHVYRVDHIVKPGETIGSENLRLFAGGKGANQSVAIAKAGAEVWHAGKIGADGKWLLEQLSEAKVQTELVSESDGPTGHAIIQVNRDGENSIILFGGANQHITDEEIEATLSNFKPGDFLVLQNEINSVPSIIKQASLQGLRIYLNPAPFSSEINTWPIELVDTLIVNESEAAGLAGRPASDNNLFAAESVIKMLAAQYPHTDIVLTAGNQGAYFVRGDRAEYQHVAAIETVVVDTTAAGDTFLGYYLVARLHASEPLEAMKRANLAASITVSRPGAMESIPFAKELQDNEMYSDIHSTLPE